jgi:hypothetical protein
LPPSGPDSEQLDLWNAIPTAGECSPDTGPACRSGPTLPRLLPTPSASDHIMERRMEHGEHYTTASGTVRRRNENGSTSNLGLVASLHLSAEGFPANPIALQENVRRLVMSVIYGASAPGSQMSLDPAGASLKTCRDYFRANAAASSPAWSVTWPRWGIASDGVFGELATLEHRTAANESSLSRIPTPQARDWKGANQNAECATGDGVKRDLR